jgi:hypothetical protein
LARVKEGTLTRDTYIYVCLNSGFKAVKGSKGVVKVPIVSTFALRFRRGTKVTVKDGSLTFNPVEGLEIRRIQRQYFVCHWGEAYPVLFPSGGKVPYPLSML